MKICPMCNGDGCFWDSIITFHDKYDGDCNYCYGTGNVNYFRYWWYLKAYQQNTILGKFLTWYWELKF